MLKENLEVEDGEQWMGWKLENLLDEFSPGSHGEGWTWNDEYHDLIGKPETQNLIKDIRINGIKKPILIGDDRRIWNGHHRIVAAIELGYKEVPVQLAVWKQKRRDVF